MPWSYPDDVPAVAENWSAEEQQACVAAANAVLEEGGTDEEAIYACIHAAGRSQEEDRMKQEYEVKNFDFQLKLLDDGEGRTFEGYASVFDVEDLQGDIIHPGAFRKTLADRGHKIKLEYCPCPKGH